jgi:tetratricopeptide (TPR) repeat protein
MRILLLVFLLSVSATPGVRGADAVSPSPAELRIAAAQKVLQKEPGRYMAYNDLATALVRRARETGDSSYYRQAEAAVANSLRIQSDNFEAGQAHVALLLGELKYSQVLEEARALNHRMPDAVLVWGYIAEADAALGDYEAAEQAAQWMMNLRPGNEPAFVCGASLRDDWGDIDGALDFLNQALQQVPPFETEETAWILTRMAGLELQAGKLEKAAPLLEQALKTFPGYYLSLEELAKVRMAEHHYSEAVELLERRNRNFATAKSLNFEARALLLAGRSADAEKKYSDFERVARGQIGLADNANLELVFYYAGQAHRPSEALRIAGLEIARRHDVRTLDAYAWALYVNGQFDEARRQIEKALAVGARGAELYYHAGTIEAAAGAKSAGIRYFQQSLEIDSASETADAARNALAQSGTRSE